MDIHNMVEQLKQERDRLSGAIAALEGLDTGTGKQGRRRGPKPRTAKVAATDFPFGAAKPKRGRRKLSAAAKRRLSESAKARWKKAKKAGRKSL
jgi:hypothetical protein